MNIDLAITKSFIAPPFTYQCFLGNLSCTCLKRQLTKFCTEVNKTNVYIWDGFWTNFKFYMLYIAFEKKNGMCPSQLNKASTTWASQACVRTEQGLRAWFWWIISLDFFFSSFKRVSRNGISKKVIKSFYVFYIKLGILVSIQFLRLITTTP